MLTRTDGPTARWRLHYWVKPCRPNQAQARYVAEPGFRLAARWNRHGETVKACKKKGGNEGEMGRDMVNSVLPVQSTHTLCCCRQNGRVAGVRESEQGEFARRAWLCAAHGRTPVTPRGSAHALTSFLTISGYDNLWCGNLCLFVSQSLTMPQTENTVARAVRFGHRYRGATGVRVLRAAPAGARRAPR